MPTAVPDLHVTAEQIQEGSFVLRATLSSDTTAPVRFAIVEGDVATGVLDTASDPREAVLCALGICLNVSDNDLWPDGAVIASGSLDQLPSSAHLHALRLP